MTIGREALGFMLGAEDASHSDEHLTELVDMFCALILAMISSENYYLPYIWHAKPLLLNSDEIVGLLSIE